MSRLLSALSIARGLLSSNETRGHGLFQCPEITENNHGNSRVTCVQLDSRT